MSQVSSYALADGDGITVLAALNALFGAVQSVNSGSAAPGSPVSGMSWLDTSVTPPVIRRRNAANTGWDLDDLTAVGLGITTITALTDISNLTVSGLYFAAYGSTGTPAYLSGYGVIHLAAPTTNGGVNLAFALSGDRVFFQRKSGGTWQPWVELPTGATSTGLAVLQAADAAAARTAMAAYGANNLAVAADITAATAGAVLDAALYTATKLVPGTAQATTSGTSKDFTGIPAWARRITVMFNGVSTNGTSLKQVQVGNSGGVITTGYASESFGAGANFGSTTGMVIGSNTAPAAPCGAMTFTRMDAGVWVQSHGFTSGGLPCAGGGMISGLATALDRIRITTLNGTDTFDAGSVNIMWE